MDEETLDNLAREFADIPLLWGTDAERLVREYRKLREALIELGIELVEE